MGACNDSNNETEITVLDLSDESDSLDWQSESIGAIPYSGSNRRDDETVLDLSEESSFESGGPSVVPYDPRPGEDGARRFIAYTLIILLAFVVIVSLLQPFCPFIDSGQFNNILDAILTPLFTLVSAATGFYYATKN